MGTTQLFITLGSCIAFMVLVGVLSYMKTKGEVNTREGYFLAGKGLTGLFIAGSLLLTNLSAEQLIGLNGSAYGFNMTAMAWEVTAGIPIIVMALYFLPKYLKGAFTTLPEFLRERFGDDVRRYTVILFMLGYGLITIPSVLYSGSVAVLQLFDLPKMFNISYELALVCTILIVGTIGAIYAIFGGLKAVAVSDTYNGVGLLLLGVLVLVLAFMKLGDGNVAQGVETMFTTETQKLNAIGSNSDPVPFTTLFTGMIFANLFYWGTNQVVIQRSLGAKNLAEGQKGVIFSGFFKVMVPFIMMVPGVIAFHLYGPGLATVDLAFPTLVADILPTWLHGFFLAVLLGAVFSSFNSLLNSAATMFCIDIYLPLKKHKVADDKLIKMAKYVSIIIALISFVITPLLMYSPEGLWQVVRVFTGFYNIPIISIVLVGLFTKRVPGFAAKVAIIFHVVVYGLYRFVFKWDIHFIHMYAILFACNVAIMLILGKIKPLPEPVVFKKASSIVDMTPWKHAVPVSILLVYSIVLLYVVFSPLGFVNGVDASFIIALITITAIALGLIAFAYKTWDRKYNTYIKNLVEEEV